MLYVLLAPDWLKPSLSPDQYSLQLQCTFDEALEYNAIGYNVFSYPNHPSQEVWDSLPVNPRTGQKRFIKAEDIDVFEYVLLDFDLKHGAYASKDAFLEILLADPLTPSKVVDSGNGIHAYYRVTDLDAMSYLRLARRVCRKFNTDEAIACIKQLLRTPGTINHKREDNPVPCELLLEDEVTYACEQMDALLPPITIEDEEYCKRHYDTAYNKATATSVNTDLPPKFNELIRTSKEVKDIWAGNVDDRSKADYRLGHLLLANGFSRDEALSVMVNAPKALQRAPVHRVGYAENIINKIFTFEARPDTSLNLHSSAADILRRPPDAVIGTPFRCHPLLDGTHHGFRLGQLIGLAAGAGVGKTTMALNMYKWFAERNPDYDHFFFSLEQPAREIAERWSTLCADNTALHSKVQIVDNYNPDGSYRHLGLEDIRQYLVKYQKVTGRKVGTCVIDHLGLLKKEVNGNDRLNVDAICMKLKAFAIETGTLVIMQSQVPREKSGAGDLELNKDAAMSSQSFEAIMDYVLTIWAPLKRCYSEGAPTVMAFKYAKIRKKSKKDTIHEDTCYQLLYDMETERLRELTQEEEISAEFFVTKATNLRKQDKKTDIVEYTSRREVS
jgi:hypothetical protein